MNQSNPSGGKKPRLSFTRGDKLAGIAVLAMLALTLILSLLQRGHIVLVRGEILLYLPFLVLFVLLGWGASAIFRRLRSRVAKLVVGSVLGVALFLVVAVIFSYVSFVATISLPQLYNTVKSPSGARRVVILRRLDVDEDRINARKERRLAADPEADGEISVDDWGYVYSAWPAAARIFYRDDADAEGEAVIGYSSESRLMMEWAEDESWVRFFPEKDIIGDEGELTLRF